MLQGHELSVTTAGSLAGAGPVGFETATTCAPGPVLPRLILPGPLGAECRSPGSIGGAGVTARGAAGGVAFSGGRVSATLAVVTRGERVGRGRGSAGPRRAQAVARTATTVVSSTIIVVRVQGPAVDAACVGIVGSGGSGGMLGR
jgi:hypothetical protein